MLITTNMGIKVDPIGSHNVNLIRYTIRPNVSSIQRTKRCLFGRSDPEQNRRIYENSANNERNRCIERYGFDPVKSEFTEKKDENKVDKNESLDNVVDDIVRDRENLDIPTSESVEKDNANEDVNDVSDVIKYKVPLRGHVQGSRIQSTKRPHETEHKTVADYFPKKKKPSS